MATALRIPEIIHDTSPTQAQLTLVQPTADAADAADAPMLDAPMRPPRRIRAQYRFTSPPMNARPNLVRVRRAQVSPALAAWRPADINGFNGVEVQYYLPHLTGWRLAFGLSQNKLEMLCRSGCRTRRCARRDPAPAHQRGVTDCSRPVERRLVAQLAAQRDGRPVASFQESFQAM